MASGRWASAERAAGFKLGQLTVISDEHQQPVGGCDVLEQSGELSGAEHPRFVIGPTPDGRTITGVVDRDSDDHGRWHVMTAWDATPAQVVLYRRAR